MDDAQLMAALEQPYRRAGGSRVCGVVHMLQRLADDASHLLRLYAFPAGFEAAALEAVTRHGKQMDQALRIDLLALACEAGYCELATALLNAGIVWLEDDAYQCARLSIQAREPALLALLLQAGVEASLRGECGTPLLAHAMATGDAVLVELLREAGARPDHEGFALGAAAIGGHLAMIEICLEHYLSAAALAEALDYAACAGQCEAVVMLLRAGAPPEPASAHATQRGDREMVDFLCTARTGLVLASGAREMT